MAELNTTSLISDANLVSYYRFESGNFLVDSKGGNTLTNNNSVANVAGRYGLGASTGTGNTNKSLTNSSNLGLGTTSACSFVGWFAFNSLSGNQALFSFSTAGITTGRFVVYTGTQFVAYNYGNASRNIMVSKALSINQYFHLAYIDNGSGVGTYDLYVDGVKLGTNTRDGTSGSFPIGLQLCNDVWNEYGNIIVDDFAIFNKALTQTEIFSLYKSKAGGSFIYQML